jgi:uncharacterized membrane protein (UPF0127 family)
VNRKSVITFVVIAIIVLATGALVLAAQWKGHDTELSVNNNTVTIDLPVVDLLCDNGSVIRLDVEVADSPDEWTHGLMDRTSLPEDAGMLFVFDDVVQRCFWMQDTLIPLDMIFIADNLTIIDIHRNATPLSEEHIYSSGPCRYVLEVNGGLCEADGIEIGDRVTLDID